MLSAKEVIAEKGIDKAGINYIADKAGINKVLIYRYFGGWNGLVEEVCKSLLNEIRPNKFETRITLHTVEKYLLMYYSLLNENEAFYQIIFWLQSNKDSIIGQKINQLMQDELNFIFSNVNSPYTALIRLMHAGIVYNRVMHSDHTIPFDEQLQGIFEILSNPFCRKSCFCYKN